MRDVSELQFLVSPTVWFLAQVKRSAADEWQTAGLANHRPEAARLAAAGYWASCQLRRGPCGSRIVPSQQLEAISATA